MSVPDSLGMRQSEWTRQLVRGDGRAWLVAGKLEGGCPLSRMGVAGDLEVAVAPTALRDAEKHLQRHLQVSSLV